MEKYLDLNGLANYDAKIKEYISDSVKGANTLQIGLAKKRFIIDAATMTAEAINTQLIEAQNYGVSIGARAEVYFKSPPTTSVMNNIVWKNNCNYYIYYNMSGGIMNLNNISNAGFRFSVLSTVSSNMINMESCSNIDFYGCSIKNGMGSSLIKNCTEIYFKDCIIKGGTFPNPRKCSCVITDTSSSVNNITFENCKFQYSNSTGWDTVIDGTDITNTNCNISLINCLNPLNGSITSGDIIKGSATWYSITPNAEIKGLVL